jgi:hypothetical protein
MYKKYYKSYLSAGFKFWAYMPTNTVLMMNEERKERKRREAYSKIKIEFLQLLKVMALCDTH